MEVQIAIARRRDASICPKAGTEVPVSQVHINTRNGTRSRPSGHSPGALIQTRMKFHGSFSLASAIASRGPMAVRFSATNLVVAIRVVAFWWRIELGCGFIALKVARLMSLHC